MLTRSLGAVLVGVQYALAAAIVWVVHGLIICAPGVQLTPAEHPLRWGGPAALVWLAGTAVPAILLYALNRRLLPALGLDRAWAARVVVPAYVAIALAGLGQVYRLAAWQ